MNGLTFKMSVIGEDRASFVCRKLISQKITFSCATRDGKEWLFTVRDEDGGSLQQAVTQSYHD